MMHNYYGMNDEAMGILFVITVFAIFALFRVLQRAGISGWWALLALFPPLFVIGMWVFAFARWPALDDRADTASAAPMPTPNRTSTRPPPPPPPPASGNRTTSERIAELDRLRAEGVITADEYERKRRDILDSI